MGDSGDDGGGGWFDDDDADDDPFGDDPPGPLPIQPAGPNIIVIPDDPPESAREATRRRLLALQAVAIDAANRLSRAEARISRLVERGTVQQFPSRNNGEQIFQSILEVLDAIEPDVRSGRYYLIQAGIRAESNVRAWYTLGPRNFDDFYLRVSEAEIEGVAALEEGSDEEIIKLLMDETVGYEIGRVAVRQQVRQGQDRQGQFFPYLHQLDDEELSITLARVGCFTEIDPANYADNCLVRAFTSAGVDEVVIADLRASCVMRSVPRYKIRGVAERHNLRVTIRTHGAHNIVHMGPTTGFEVPLALYKGHYFHNFKTIYNAYAIKNYHAVKLKNIWWEYKDHRSRGQYGMYTLKLLQTLVETGDTLTPIDLATPDIFSTQFYDRANAEFTTLEYPADAVRPTHEPRFQPDSTDEALQRKHSELITELRSTTEGRATQERLQAKFTRTGMGLSERTNTLRRHRTPAARIFMDFESSTDGTEHKAYVGCWSVDGSHRVYTTDSQYPGIELLQWIVERYGGPINKPTPKVVLIAHNVTYDAAFLMHYLERLELIERGTSIITGKGHYTSTGADGRELKVWLEFKDSQKMIAGSLASFAEKFKLPILKEVMPYDLYTEAFIAGGAIADDSTLSQYACYDKLMVNLLSIGRRTEAGWDMMHYSAWYCQADVRLLQAGWNVFRKDTLHETDIDINHYPTTASLADTHLTEEGCYDGVYEVSGIPREFISRANVGGKVMCRNNQPECVDHPEGLADFDAVSLYPSAMVAMPGYLKGKPKVWYPGVSLDHVDGYFLKLRITSIAKGWAFPICRLPTKTGGNDWTNDLVGHELYVDKRTLEDLVEHSGVQYEILQGYFYDEGFNTQIGGTMRKMFEDRLRLKAAGSSAQEGKKLMMNSAYGKCGLKPINTEVTYLTGERADAFIHNHHNSIKAFTMLPNGTLRFETHKAINTHFNKQHLSCMVLSWSKFLMHRVMCLAEDIGANIYYTDTDSMHIESNKVEPLADAFRVRYGLEMVGKGLGQFHVDFDFKSCFFMEGDTLNRNSIQSVGAIKSVQAIFLGKKSYIDKLEDEVGNEAYHIRLKGIPVGCITNKCNGPEYGGDPIALFQDLFDGRKVDFKLGSDGHVMFKTRKDHTIVSQTMTRTISFKTN
jgi:hypothetical protein